MPRSEQTEVWHPAAALQTLRGPKPPALAERMHTRRRHPETVSPPRANPIPPTRVGLRRVGPLGALTLLLATALARTQAQPVALADPNLESAVRESIGKFDGGLTQTDFLLLTNLVAPRRAIASLDGFPAAPNLESLDLEFNQLPALTLTQSYPHLQRLNLAGNGLTNFTLTAPQSALDDLNLSENVLTDVAFLEQLPALRSLALQANDLAAFLPPVALPHLESLDLSFNRVTNLAFLSHTTNISVLVLDDNGLTGLNADVPLPLLRLLSLAVNRVRDLAFLARYPSLEYLVLPSNGAQEYAFPPGLSNLVFIDFGENRLTNLVFPRDITRIGWLHLDDNRLTTLPDISRFPDLVFLDLSQNQLTSVTLPPAATNLLGLDLAFNPLQTLVLPEVLAIGQLSNTVATLQSQGVTIHPYPVQPRLEQWTVAHNATLAFTLKGPPGVYDVQRSATLDTWSLDRPLTNRIGTVEYSGTASAPTAFLRAWLPDE